MNPQEINQIYNQLEVKDMPRQVFVKKVQELTSQSGVQRDLGTIMAGKRMVAKRKQKIDRAIENGPSRRN
jgi:hypothetical protein